MVKFVDEIKIALTSVLLHVLVKVDATQHVGLGIGLNWM